MIRFDGKVLARDYIPKYPMILRMYLHSASKYLDTTFAKVIILCSPQQMLFGGLIDVPLVLGHYASIEFRSLNTF